jgi:hypothetical protein
VVLLALKRRVAKSGRRYEGKSTLKQRFVESKDILLGQIRMRYQLKTINLTYVRLHLRCSQPHSIPGLPEMALSKFN